LVHKSANCVILTETCRTKGTVTNHTHTHTHTQCHCG